MNLESTDLSAYFDAVLVTFRLQKIGILLN